MKNTFLLTKVLLVLLASPAAFADLIFEGYYKYKVAGQHIGYYIQRYELDTAAKTFSSTYYFYSKTAEGTSTESLSAKSSSTFAPLSYQFTSLTGNHSKVIDALVKKDKLIIKTVENNKATVREMMVNDKKHVFSSFVTFLMMKNNKGVAVGNKFTYDAIAEEDGTINAGEAFVKELVKEKGIDAYRTLNTFQKNNKKEEFIAWINIKGEVIKAQFPEHQVEGELVANPKEATQDFPVNESNLKLLFGKIPEGKTNQLSKK